MLAAVTGLLFLVSAILRLENSLGYLLPLPIVLSALRSGAAAGWKTMIATCLLLIVLLGPLRAASYLLMHGLLAATLGMVWGWQWGFWLTIVIGALVRMTGQLTYLMLSSFTMNENLFALMLGNIYATLDHFTAALGFVGTPSSLLVLCMVFSLLLVNNLLYNFLSHVFYRVVLSAMGFKLSPLPRVIKKVLYPKAVLAEEEAAAAAAVAAVAGARQ